MIIIDPFHGTSVGAAMFDHVATHPLLASVATAFTMQARDAGAAQQTSVSTNIIGGDCARRKALATAVEDMLSELITSCSNGESSVYSACTKRGAINVFQAVQTFRL